MHYQTLSHRPDLLPAPDQSCYIADPLLCFGIVFPDYSPIILIRTIITSSVTAITRHVILNIPALHISFNDVFLSAFNLCYSWLNEEVRFYVVTINHIHFHYFGDNLSIFLITSNSIPPSQESSTSKPTSSQLKFNPSRKPSSPTPTFFNEYALSATRIADYLKDPTSSHVQPRHFHPEESLRMHTKTINSLREIDHTLTNYKK